MKIKVLNPLELGAAEVLRSDKGVIAFEVVAVEKPAVSVLQLQPVEASSPELLELKLDLLDLRIASAPAFAAVAAFAKPGAIAMKNEDIK